MTLNYASARMRLMIACDSANLISRTHETTKSAMTANYSTAPVVRTSLLTINYKRSALWHMVRNDLRH